MIRWIEAVRRRRRGVVAGALVLAGAAAPGLLRLETDNSPGTFFLRDSPSVARYRAFTATFGSDEIVRVVASGPGLWTTSGQAWLARVEGAAAALPGVEAVSGLPSYEGDAWPAAEPKAYRERARADALARAFGWIDARGELVTLTVALAPASSREEDAVLASLEQALEPRPPGVDVALAGGPALNRALDRSSREIETRFLPLLVLLATLVLVGALRSPAGVALPLAFVGFCELVVLGSAGWAGVRLNLVLAILPPLLFSIALATALHLVVRFRDLQAEGRAVADAVREAWRDKWSAVVWTGLTTAVGFGAFAASPVAPVRSLGVLVAAAVVVVTFAALTLLPALLLTWPPVGGSRSRRGLERLAGRLGRSSAELAVRRRWAGSALALLAVGVALAGVPRLRPESNALSYLAPDNPVRRAIQGLEARGIGSAAIEVVVERTGGFLDGRGMQQLELLTLRIREETDALEAVGAGDLVAAALRRSPEASRAIGSAAPRQAALDELRSRPSGRRALAAFVSADGRRARLTAFVRTEGSVPAEGLRRGIERLVREELPEARLETLGEYLLLLETQRFLLGTLRDSLLLTLAGVSVCFAVLLRRTSLVGLALVPNLWPVGLVLGLMGWAAIPLDIATVMVASVVLGLAVDNTIHTLAHFRELEPGLGAAEAVATTLQRTAPAYLLTALILAAGFGSCAMSDFAPIRRFGGLAALAVGLALAADLLLVPALLALVGPRQAGAGGIGDGLAPRGGSTSRTPAATGCSRGRSESPTPRR